MVNKIFSYFIIIGIVYSFIKGNTDVINNEILNVGSNSLNIILKLFPIMCLWLGIVNIAKSSGLIDIISKKMSKILKYIFPEIPENHESMGLISLNIVMNMLGLGNAATPIGLKAIKSLKELNNNKDEVTRSMRTFVVINTSGLTLIPTTIISLRMANNSTNPTSILLACVICTFTSTIVGIIIDRIYYLIRGKK